MRKRLALAHDVHPVVAGGHDLAVMRGARVERAFLQHRCVPGSNDRGGRCGCSRSRARSPAPTAGWDRRPRQGGPSKISKRTGFARIARRRAQRMRAGVEEDERVHLEAQLDGRAGLGGARIERHRAVVGHGDLAEPVDVRGKIAPAEAVFGGFDQEAVVAVLLPVVAIGLIAALAPLARRPTPWWCCRRPCRASRRCRPRSSRRCGPCRNRGSVLR